jgi:hypothetical protein
MRLLIEHGEWKQRKKDGRGEEEEDVSDRILSPLSFFTRIVKEKVTSRWICSLISETHYLSHCWYRSRSGPVR